MFYILHQVVMIAVGAQYVGLFDGSINGQFTVFDVYYGVATQ